MQKRPNIRQLAADMLRCLLAFTLAFSLVLYAERTAWAEGESETGTEQPADESTVTTTVEGITLYYETPYTGTGWAIASNSWEDVPAEHSALTAKGQTLSFRVQLVWNDGSTSDAGGTDHPVSWAVNDTSIATISTSGVLTAVANGTVLVTATADGLCTSYYVDISGQNNELYVSAVAIVDANGTPYETSGAGATLTDLNSTLQLYARVTVTDPATGASTDYYTFNGSLSSQTGGAISDLSWSINDTNFGYIEPTTGLFRPSEYANVMITATSMAGLGGATVTGSMWVATSSPGQESSESRPQDSLTVRVYYEEVPDQIVSEVTFTRAEIEAMNMFQCTYTAIGNGNTFASASGSGVLFTDILEAAGANLNGIKYFSFVTADTPSGSTYGTTVSYSLLFGKSRYFYPNYDLAGSTQGAVQVWPMLAVYSNFRWYESGAWMGEDYDTMTDAACFRLLFGATNDGQINTMYQIYWINTINVVLEGAPPSEPEVDPDPDPDPDPSDDGTNDDTAGDGTADDGSSPQDAESGTDGSAADGTDSGSSDSGAQSGSSDDGSGSGSNSTSTQSGTSESGSGSDSETTNVGPSASTEASEGAEGESGSEGDAGGSEDGTSGGSSRSWNVYQMMNANESDVAGLDFENPWAPYVAPMTCGIAAAGATQMGVRYRRQRLPLR